MFPTHSEPTEAFSCLLLPSKFVSDIEALDEEVRSAELTYFEANRLAAMEKRSRGKVSDVLLERNDTLWKERENKEELRRLAVTDFVSEVLSSRTTLAVSHERSISQSLGGDLPEYQTSVTCSISANVSQRFALVAASGTSRVIEGGTFMAALGETISKESGQEGKSRIHIAVPSSEQFIDKISVSNVFPKAADATQESEIKICSVGGFDRGLRCSVQTGSQEENVESSAAKILDTSCALCTIPGLQGAVSEAYTSIDLFYDPMCRKSIDMYRYKAPKIMGVRTSEASRYGKTAIEVFLEAVVLEKLVNSPHLFTPSCQLQSLRDGSLFAMEAEIVQSNSSILCSASSIVEGEHQVGLSLNDLQYNYFGGDTFAVEASEIWIEDVEYQSNVDEIIAAVHIARNSFAGKISADLKMTLTTSGKEISKTHPVSWNDDELPQIVRIPIEDDTMPRVMSKLELSLANPHGVNIRDSGAIVLWDKKVMEGFALKSRAVLHYKDSKKVSLEFASPHNFQFQEATIRLRSRGGSAIPNYHYLSSYASHSLEKGYKSCDVLGEFVEGCTTGLDVEILWDNIRPSDFLTIDVELSYEQNDEVLSIVFENAILVWGLEMYSSSCPSGFSKKGLVSEGDFLDFGDLKFQLLADQAMVSESLSLHPPYNPTVKAYSTVTSAPKVWVQVNEFSNETRIERVHVSLQNEQQHSQGDFVRPFRDMRIPLELDHGANQAHLIFATRSNEKAMYQIDIFRVDPSESIKSLAILDANNETSTLCAHNNTAKFPFCIPGSHVSQQVKASSELMVLQANSNLTISSPFITGREETESGLTNYTLSSQLLQEHTFSVGYDLDLNRKKRITVTLDWVTPSEFDWSASRKRVFYAMPGEDNLDVPFGQAFPECELCPKGYFANEINSTFCKPCNAGYFSNHSGAGVCDTCSPGHYSLDYANSECRPCLRGLYMPLFGGKECLECPSNATTVEDGSNSCTLVVKYENRLPTLIVEFTLTLNATKLSGIGMKLGVHNISDERAIGILIKDDTAAGFSTVEHKVKPTDIQVSMLDFQDGGLLMAKINVTLVPSITLKSSEKERVEAMKQLSDISADKGITMLADDPDQFFGRTLEAINGTSTVDHIMQRETSHLRGKGGGLPISWAISLSVFSVFTLALSASKLRRRCAHCVGKRRASKRKQRHGSGTHRRHGNSRVSEASDVV